MKRRNLFLLGSLACLAACAGGESATAISDTTVNGTGTTGAADPTPLQSGVDYTQMADFSGYDSWVCDNDSIMSNGATLSPQVTVVEDPGALRILLSSNSIPDHRVGDFPNSGNPNTIGEVGLSYEVAMRVEMDDPEKSTRNAAPIVGMSLGGIHLDPMTGEFYNNDRTGGWNYEALTIGAAANSSLAGAIGYLGTDCNNAHVQPTGKYHYHGMPEELVSDLLAATGKSLLDPEMVMIGYAADGYPMYARYGYADPLNPASGIVELAGSYELKTGTRPSGPGGSYDGTFTNDWEYVDGSGDLDACNGRYGMTPEYPNGIYHYFVTDDYPFLPRCVWGSPTADSQLGPR